MAGGFHTGPSPVNSLSVREVRHLIVRLPNWLGDTVMALPALKALRAGCDVHRITLVGPWAFLLTEQGVADGCVVYPRGAGKRLIAARAIRRLSGDVALLFPNSMESALAAWLWGARWIVGYATDGRGRLLSHSLPLPAPRRHQVDEYLALLAPFGIDHADATPRWTLLPQAYGQRLEILLPSQDTHGGARIGIHLGAALGPSKLWPSDRLAVLCHELRDRGCVPVLLGPASEEATANAVVTSAGGEIISLVGKDSAELLPALLGRLDVLVSMDTGVAHLAAAVGVPVVTLFGPTDPGLTAPRGSRVSVIWKPPPCAPCFLAVCPIEHPCMRAITVDEVLRAVEAGVATRRQ